MKKRTTLSPKEQNEKTLRELRQNKLIRSVRIYGANDQLMCSDCKGLSGKEYPIEQSPELPHPKCTSEKGCRCYYQPVVSIEALEDALDDILKD